MEKRMKGNKATIYKSLHKISAKATLCHFCGGREEKGVHSAKKKANKCIHGRFLGRRWYPCH